MCFPFVMTENDLLQITHGNLVIAPSSCRRWQRISFKSQRRSLLESVGTIQCLDDTDGEGRRGVRHPVKSRTRWQGRTCMSMHVRKRMSEWMHQPTARASKNTSKHMSTPPGDGSAKPAPPPVSSQLSVTRVTQLRAQPAQPQLEKDKESGKMEKIKNLFKMKGGNIRMRNTLKETRKINDTRKYAYERELHKKGGKDFLIFSSLFQKCRLFIHLVRKD